MPLHPQERVGSVLGESMDCPLGLLCANIQERIWHHSQTNRINSDGSVELSMNVSLSAELKQWLLGFGPEVEVLAPQKLAEDIFEVHFEACRKARPDLFRGMNVT